MRLNPKTVMNTFFLIGIFLSFFMGRASLSHDEINAAAVRQFVADLPQAPLVVPGVYRFEIKVDEDHHYKVKVVTTVE